MLAISSNPGGALAHMSGPGMNEGVAGVIHPFMTPAHVLVLLGIGLLLGQQFSRHFKTALLTFASAAAVTLLLTTTRWVASVPPSVLLSIALAAGAMVALETSLSTVSTVAIFAAAAVALGFDSGVEIGTARKVVETLLGTWLGLTVGLTNIAFGAALVAEKKKKWMSIGLRIAGSWLVAISLLALAFSLRK